MIAVFFFDQGLYSPSFERLESLLHWLRLSAHMFLEHLGCYHVSKAVKIKSRLVGILLFAMCLGWSTYVLIDIFLRDILRIKVDLLSLVKMSLRLSLIHI